MKFVEPIRCGTTYNLIKDTLKEENERDYVFFLLGTYTALRVSDILKLKIKDVRNRQTINLIENKTGKQQIIKLNKEVMKALSDFSKSKLDNEFLLKSNKGVNKPISRVRAWQIMKDIGSRFEIENLGCHSLRKTWGYHYYKQTGDIATIMLALNHSREDISLRYIGILQDQVNKARESFEIN